MARISDVTILFFFTIFLYLPRFSDLDGIQFANLLFYRPEERRLLFQDIRCFQYIMKTLPNHSLIECTTFRLVSRTVMILFRRRRRISQQISFLCRFQSFRKKFGHTQHGGIRVFLQYIFIPGEIIIIPE